MPKRRSRTSLTKRNSSSLIELLTNQVNSLGSYYYRHSPVILDLMAGFICLLSFGMSAIESTVNLDSHHWGLMYLPALELKQGLIACKDVLIYYGVLTSWLQSVGLSVFGENFRGLGITTGLFHSLNLLLLYQIFKSFLGRHSAFFAVLIAFLLHGYIIYPWSNYFAYTFELLAVISIIKLDGLGRYLLAGFCVGLALLARYSSLQAVLPPFILFFLYQYIACHTTRRRLFNQCILFFAGLLAPLVAFIMYLVVNRGLDNFILHNALTLRAMVAKGRPGFNAGPENFLKNLLSGRVLSMEGNLIEIDSRSIFLSFLCLAVFSMILLMFSREIYFSRLPFKKPVPNLNSHSKDQIIALVSLVSLFGFLNGLNLYEVFRVVNGASIGIGLIFYWIESLWHSNLTSRFLAWPMIFILSFLLLNWSNTIIFSKTTSTYFPWTFLSDQTNLVKQMDDIKVLEGKVMPPELSRRYIKIKQVMDPYNSSFPIVNYTLDSISVLVDPNRPRLQKSPAFFPAVQAGLPDEVDRIEQAIASRKAIVIAYPESITPLGFPVVREIPGYRHEQIDDSIVMFIPN